ncbi:TLC ATP/ADP transporter [Candidatus Arcanobacter lacustris]|uniref:ADP,ATP carrier protein n=1 Tax=Candidatus Arcanibacter lacustris TaxID=1607817 RepID=A0A0F5MNC2_9RICK|nr:TLC ATP/ADP transporter [Candidatus Arcanobacter lacustris]
MILQKEKTPNLLHKLYYLDKDELLKLIIGGFLFFCIIGSYSLCEEMKYGVFSLFIGAYYIPIAKMIAFGVLIPAIMLDGYLVDRIKRHQLLISYCIVFALLAIIFSIVFTHPEIGISNNIADPSRIIGWIFYVYIEGFQPFLIGVFWAFMNSIHQPTHAKKTYGLIVSCSKIAGISVTILAATFFSANNFFQLQLDITQKIQIILLVSSGLLLSAALFLSLMVKKLNISTFKGYHTDSAEETSKKTGIFLGISLLLKNRYVLGVFLMVFLGDIVSEILNYKRILLSVPTKEHAKDLGTVLSSLYSQLAYMHLIGLGISLFFTNSIMRYVSTRVCIFIMPVFTFILAIVYIATGIDSVIVWLYIIIKAMYYTIGTPIRESLYIVTSKDIQFKAKFAIDAVGQKLARNTGQAVNFATNILRNKYGAIYGVVSINTLLVIIPMMWIVASYFVGKKYKETLDNNEVIS